MKLKEDSHHSQINRLEEKEEARKMAEAELVHLRQELLLMGELQIKYREKFRSPSIVSRKQEELFTQAYEAQISGE